MCLKFFLALKCNYNKEVVRMLINLGCGIDCASEVCFLFSIF